MIDMFTNYQNLSEHYIPNNLAQHQTKPHSYTKFNPCEITKPYELYNAKNELEGYYWHYGDAINLDFSIEGEVTLDDGTYITANDFLKDKLYTIKLYDFRLNEIYTQAGKSSTNIVLNIDKNLSSKFVRGVYYCSLQISGKEFQETLFSPQDCKLLVK